MSEYVTWRAVRRKNSFHSKSCLLSQPTLSPLFFLPSPRIQSSSSREKFSQSRKILVGENSKMWWEYENETLFCLSQDFLLKKTERNFCSSDLWNYHPFHLMASITRVTNTKPNKLKSKLLLAFSSLLASDSVSVRRGSFFPAFFQCPGKTENFSDRNFRVLFYFASMACLIQSGNFSLMIYDRHVCLCVFYVCL